jgi:membrane protein DedA with SNARE-associated domain
MLIGADQMSASMDLAGVVTMLVEAGPIGIGCVALAEKLFPVVPSYVVFVLLGMATAVGQTDLAVSVAATAIGSTIGALGWYCVGLALGPKRVETLVERFGRLILLKPAFYRRMAGAYTRNHFWITVVGQTIPVVRIYLSIPAGVLNLALVNFLVATLIGSLAWSGPLLALGYVLRSKGADAASLGLAFVVALIGLEVVVLLVWRQIRHRRNGIHTISLQCKNSAL